MYLSNTESRPAANVNNLQLIDAFAIILAPQDPEEVPSKLPPAYCSSLKWAKPTTHRHLEQHSAPSLPHRTCLIAKRLGRVHRLAHASRRTVSTS